MSDQNISTYKMKVVKAGKINNAIALKRKVPTAKYSSRSSKAMRWNADGATRGQIAPPVRRTNPRLAVHQARLQACGARPNTFTEGVQDMDTKNKDEREAAAGHRGQTQELRKAQAPTRATVGATELAQPRWVQRARVGE